MEKNNLLDALTLKMFEFNRGDALRNQHFIKVHRFAQLIGKMEQLDEHTQFILECAALVHDIGIRPSEEKYGKSNGKLQEKEGPAYAEKLLSELELDHNDIERVCYLVGHHHTYDNIDGIDYQILVEADFLVNFFEDEMSRESIESAIKKIFKTDAGKQLCSTIYNI